MEITAVLTADATVKNVKEGKQVVAFSMVINDDYKTKGGEKKEVRTFIDCNYWRSTAIAQYLKKGSVVTVAGRIGINAYQNSEGKYVAKLTFTTDAIKIIATTKKSNAASN
jgi:single-strand DNA-binding protein